ncbi:hypothetical protein [Lactiplantibacillus plantarum]|uniref:hypothetical protein n=1 Tax=Lactiplantibacillus plantarum TaxID=1590 RepID=UPI0009774E09|nr:hypothetical protein [Lactiplantibacillus plantarum]
MSNELAQQYQEQQLMGGNVTADGSMQVSNASREMEEVKGQIFMAKQFPRNTFQAQKRIQDACKRRSLAMSATYSYPKGGQNVTGPSIRLAEVLAQNWGNIAFGFKELDQDEESSTAMAYAWDVETNTRQERIFQVPHAIHTRKGMKVLSDPRDIYELIANQASRRVRACILSIIPGDIVEDAVAECNKTLSGENTSPLKDRLTRAFNAFKDKYDVTQVEIETYFGYPASEFTESNLVKLVAIMNSLNDGMTKAEDWFIKEADDAADSKDIADDFNKQSKTTTSKPKAKKAAAKVGDEDAQEQDDKA